MNLEVYYLQYISHHKSPDSHSLLKTLKETVYLKFQVISYFFIITYYIVYSFQFHKIMINQPILNKIFFWNTVGNLK